MIRRRAQAEHARELEDARVKALELEEARVEALKLRFENLQRENDRLRDARASVTRQLGPLPISAAIVAGLVSGFSVSGKAHLNHKWLWLSLITFLAMVIVSMLYSALKPYRRLREEAERGSRKQKVRRRRAIDHPEPEPIRVTGCGTPADWYEAMIRLETRVKGSSLESPNLLKRWARRYLPLPSTLKEKSLAAGFDLEWQGLFLTKLLFVATIALLILARIGS